MVRPVDIQVVVSSVKLRGAVQVGNGQQSHHG